MKFTKFIIGLLVYTFTITSCDNEENTILNVDCNKKDILTFKTEEEFDSTLKVVSAMKSEDRKKWEKSKGFQSFGTICDNVYDNIDPSKFKDVKDVNAFIASQSNYIKLHIDNTGETYCETIEFENSERYLLNVDKMYIIGTTAYKIVDSELVTSDISNIKTLQKVNSTSLQKLSGFRTIKRLPFQRSKNQESNTITDDNRTNGNTYRLKLMIQTEIFHYTLLDWKTDRETEFTITNYSRSLGIWWGKPLTTSYSIRLESLDEKSGIYDTVSEAGCFCFTSHNVSSKIYICDGISWDYVPEFYSTKGTIENSKGCKISL